MANPFENIRKAGRSLPYCVVTSLMIEMIVMALIVLGGSALMLPFRPLLFLFCVSLAIELFRGRLRNHQYSQAVIHAVGTLVAVSAVLIWAATYRPAKTEEHVLNRVLSLESEELTLGELDCSQYSHRSRFKVPMYITLAEENQHRSVRFPSRNPTLREFLQQIESQTSLRYKFRSCGNGWTLLYGDDCCFGVHLYDQVLQADTTHTKKVYSCENDPRDR